MSTERKRAELLDRLRGGEGRVGSYIVKIREDRYEARLYSEATGTFVEPRIYAKTEEDARAVLSITGEEDAPLYDATEEGGSYE